jgi:hypothetical protein
LLQPTTGCQDVRTRQRHFQLRHASLRLALWSD